MQSKSLSILIAVALACSLNPIQAFADTSARSSWFDQALDLDTSGALGPQSSPNLPAREGDAGKKGQRIYANSWRYSAGYPQDVLKEMDKNQGITTMGAWSDLQMGDLDISDTWSKSNGVNTYTVRTTPTATGRIIQVPTSLAVGIDVSAHNNMPPGHPANAINWNLVKADGVSFAIIRCGYGSDYADQDDMWFAENYKGAKAAGLQVGVYLYSYAPKATGTAPSAASEADHVLRILKENGVQPADLALPVYLDLEDVSQEGLEKGTLGAIAQTFCSKMQAAGYKVGIYANQYWFNTVLKNDSPVFAPETMKANSWSRWAARYSGGDSAPGVENSDIWQFTCVGAVAGIPKKYCDVNFALTDFGLGTSADSATVPKEDPSAAAQPWDLPTDALSISYELNGGKNNAANPIEATEDVVLQNPTRKGYTFGGWYLDEGLKTKVSVLSVDDAADDEVTVYAKWFKNYKITYKLNGGKNHKANPKKFGGVLVLKNPTRKGYTFKGWYTNKKLTKKVTKLTVKKNRTVYAKWKKGTYYRVTSTDGLNIRATPSIMAAAKGALPRGKKVLIVKTSKGWGKLSGNRGWIKLEFAKKV